MYGGDAGGGFIHWGGFTFSQGAADLFFQTVYFTDFCTSKYQTIEVWVQQ